jgi:hypothetical protein
VVSQDKDFFQILSPQVRLLRFAQKGPGCEFCQLLAPCQIHDMGFASFGAKIFFFLDSLDKKTKCSVRVYYME